MRVLSNIILSFVCGYAAWGQECSSPSAVTHYKVVKFAKKKKQLSDPEFIADVKSQLIRQISSAVDVDQNKTTSLSGTKESSKYNSNVDITSSGLIINPQIDICVDKITMSVEKKFVHDLSRNYLTKVIDSDTKSMLALIQHSTTTNKTFLKDQYSAFKKKEKYYSGLIPLALESKKEFSLEDYEDFKTALYLLGTKANSSIVARVKTYTKPKRVSKKKSTVAKQSGGYYKTKTTYKGDTTAKDKHTPSLSLSLGAGYNLGTTSTWRKGKEETLALDEAEKTTFGGYNLNAGIHYGSGLIFGVRYNYWATSETYNFDWLDVLEHLNTQGRHEVMGDIGFGIHTAKIYFGYGRTINPISGEFYHTPGENTRGANVYNSNWEKVTFDNYKFESFTVGVEMPAGGGVSGSFQYKLWYANKVDLNGVTNSKGLVGGNFVMTLQLNIF